MTVFDMRGWLWNTWLKLIGLVAFAAAKTYVGITLIADRIRAALEKVVGRVKRIVRYVRGKVEWDALVTALIVAGGVVAFLFTVVTAYSWGFDSGVERAEWRAYLARSAAPKADPWPPNSFSIATPYVSKTRARFAKPTDKPKTKSRKKNRRHKRRG